MNHTLKFAFFRLIVHPVMWVLLGLRVRNAEKLPLSGPAIIVANHNSHLDTMAVMSLFPGKLLPRIRPVGAADYFMRNRWWAWFAQRVLGMVPIERRARTGARERLAECSRALDDGDILIVFPEGGRGEPEQRAPLKSGIAHLAANHRDVPVVPLYLKGLGKTLPKGESLPVPFDCHAAIGNPLKGSADRREFMRRLNFSLDRLEAESPGPAWR